MRSLLSHPFPSKSTHRWHTGRTALMLSLAAALLPAAPVHAANLTWKGGDGTWGTTGAWSGGDWVAGSTAIFSSPIGAVIVGTQTAGGLTFNASGYSLTGAGTLTLATGSALTTTSGTTTFSSTLFLAGAGGVSLAKSGHGILSLATSNTGLGTAAIPATWVVDGGTLSGGVYDSILSVNLGNNLGVAPTAATTEVTLNAGTLQVRGAGSPAIGATRNIQVNAGGGAIADLSGGGNSYQSAITAGGPLYLSNTGGTATFSGIIGGTGGLTWNGTGSLVLSGTNTFTGATSINAGTLQFTTAVNLGSAAGTLNLAGGTLASAQTAAVAMTRTLATGTTGGTIQLNNGLPSAATSKITLATAGQLTGSGPLTVASNGVLSIGAANPNFSGKWTLNGGVVELTSGTAGGTGGFTVNTGAELSTLGSQIANPLTLNGGRIGWDFYSGSGDYQGLVTLGSGGGIVSLVNFYGAGAISGTVSGIIGGTGALSTSSTGPTSTTNGGVLTLSGNNTYTGGTTVGAGTTLKVASATALGGAANPLTVAGTLNVNGYNVAAGPLTLANGSTFSFNLGTNTTEGLAAGSVSQTGTSFFAFNTAGLTGPATYNLISNTGGFAGTFGFSGSENLTVPASSIIAKNSSGVFYRLTLANTPAAVQLVVSGDVPARVFTVFPYGSSITAGQSAQSPYNGGGYRQQLYQNLVNDGRFTPDFVGSSVALLANSPTGGNILTQAGQTHHEGHPGWNTIQMLANLGSTTNGDPDANGGHWLEMGNGENPDVITVNVGGNDAVNYGANATAMTAAAQRLDATVSRFSSLRPGVSTVLSTIAYRGDNSGAYSTQGIDPYYNPVIGDIVFNHVLAGQSVGYLDLRGVMDYSTDTSSDHIHPFQAGYDKMANAWYQSLAYGAVYWTGNRQDGVWNTVNANATNWATDPTLAIDRRKSLVDPATTTFFVYPDVFFGRNTASLPTTLGADTTVRSLNFTAGATGAVTIGAGNTLTIGAVDTTNTTGAATPYTLMNTGGITVQAGSGAHTVAADIVLGADQTWGNVSSSPLTVGGAISGARNLAFAGAYTVYQPGVYTPNGTDYKNVTYTTVSQTAGGTGGFVLGGNSPYSGTTTLASNAKLIVNGTLSATSAVNVGAGTSLAVNGTINPAVGVSLGGSLSGAGSVGSVVTTAGAAITPGNTTGTLTAGAVTLAANAALNIVCGSSNTGNKLVVTGNAQLAGVINVALLPHSGVTAFNREIITVGGTLDATGLRIGTVPAELSAGDFSLGVNGGHVLLQYSGTAAGGSYSFFQTAYFTPAQGADPSVSGPAADPNADGLPNALAYALGLDPTVPSAGSPFRVSLQGSNPVTGPANVLALGFDEPANPPSDATLNVRQGTDLTATAAAWPVIASRSQAGIWTTSGGAQVAEGAGSNGFAPVTVYGSLPSGSNAKAFLRVEVSLSSSSPAGGRPTSPGSTRARARVFSGDRKTPSF